MRPFSAFAFLFVSLCYAATLSAQQNELSSMTVPASASSVPRLIKFSGTLLDEQGRPMKSPVGVTFALYAHESEGPALWMETQNVETDERGNYSVLLGANSGSGIPADLFNTGEARWLGVQAEHQPEQPRVLLVSVPYALKAGDAQTLGGLPPSAFSPATSVASSPVSSSSASSATLLVPSLATAAAPLAAISGSGTADFIPLWTPNGSTLGNSILFQSTASNVNVHGSLSLPAIASATAALGQNSRPLDFLASSFNSSPAPGAAVTQHFRWQAEPVANNTTSPSGKLNLLFASGTAIPAETGLSISSKGIISFAPGQTLPSVIGNETVNGNFTTTGFLTGNNGEFTSNLGVGVSPTFTSALNVSSSTANGVSAASRASNGTALAGDATGRGNTVGVMGVSSSSAGLAGLFNNTAGGKILSGQSAGKEVFSVNGSGNVLAGGFFSSGQVLASTVVVAPFGILSGASIDEGDAGCGPSYAGIGFGGLSGCSNYSILGNGQDTFLNRRSGGAIHFREGNAEQVTLFSGGGLYATSNVRDAVHGESSAFTGAGVAALTTVANGNAVIGTLVQASTTGAGESSGQFVGAGVWGDSGEKGGKGVFGTADDGFGVSGANNSNCQDTSQICLPAVNAVNATTDTASLIFRAVANNNPTGVKICYIDTSANFVCPTSAAVVLVDGGSRRVAFYAVESPEHWFDDYGSGQLVNGEAIVSLDPTYVQTVNTNMEYHVFLTPRGDSLGLYVAKETPTSFVVREQSGGKSSIAFDYLVVAKRNGYEQIRFEDKSEMFRKVEAGLGQSQVKK
jgi:hypothetical protein